MNHHKQCSTYTTDGTKARYPAHMSTRLSINFNGSRRKAHHLHLSLGEDSRLTLWQVDGGSSYSHRCAGLDGDCLGDGLRLAVRLYLWIRSDHHGVLLVISERCRSPASSWRMILLAMFSIPAAVCFSTTLRGKK